MSTYIAIKGSAVASSNSASARSANQIFFDTTTNKWYITLNNGSTVQQVVTTN